MRHRNWDLRCEIAEWNVFNAMEQGRNVAGACNSIKSLGRSDPRTREQKRAGVYYKLRAFRFPFFSLAWAENEVSGTSSKRRVRSCDFRM